MDTNVSNQPERGVGSVIKDSWDLVKGFKWCAFKVFIPMILVICAVEFTLLAFFQPAVLHPDPVTHQIPPINPLITSLSSFISWFFFLPLLIMGVRHSIGLPPKAGTAYKAFFNSFGGIIGIIIGLLIISLIFSSLVNYLSHFHSIITLIVYLFIVILNILIGITGIFAMLLVVTKKLSTIEAVKQSFQGMINHIGVIFGSYILLIIIMLISILPILIGLIWTIPMSFLVLSVLFRNIFGVKNGVSLSNAQPGASEYTF